MPPGGESRGDRQPRRTDVALAAGLLVAGQVEVWLLPAGDAGHLRGALAVLLAAGPLAWRRRAPLPVALAVAAGIAVSAPASGLVQFLCVLIAVFGVAAGAPPRSAALGLGAVLAAQTAAIAVGPDSSVVNVLYAAGLYGAAWLTGLAFRHRATQIGLLRNLTRQLREEQLSLSRMVVAGERARIARELHDVIAHSVSVMVVQAGAAEQLLRSDPDRAQRALEAVQQSGEQAAAELRRLLGVLRADPDGGQPAPAPGLADLPRLIDQMRSAGLDVSCRVEGVARPLPPGVDLAAYRVLQEALTNVVKHARGSRVAVTVRHTAREVTLVVADSGAATSGSRPAGAAFRHPEGQGHGLVGLRERCALYGGTLRTGGGPAGFTVEATLPRDDPGGALSVPLPAPAEEARR